MARENNRKYIKSPWLSIEDPLISNDSIDTADIGSQFYIGDFWYNTITKVMWYCVDNSIGNAIWLDIASTEGTKKCFNLVFGRVGTVSNKWLYTTSDNPSNDSPLILIYNSSLKRFSFSNKNNDIEAQIQIYKNNDLIYTSSTITSKTWVLTTDINVNYESGDSVSVYVKKVGCGWYQAQDVVVMLSFS